MNRVICFVDLSVLQPPLIQEDKTLGKQTLETGVQTVTNVNMDS